MIPAAALKVGLGVSLVALVASLAGGGYQTWRLARETASHSATIQTLERERRERAEADREALILGRRVSDAMARTVQEAQHARETELEAQRLVADRLRTQRDRLRGDIQAYARGPADDTRAACSDRAATLGLLLDDAVRTAATCVGGAEKHASDLRTVLKAWPRTGALTAP